MDEKLKEDSCPKIVVMTPVKNEAWILPRFLAVTSQFADHIIIADQNSSDESRKICMRFPKVTLIENEDDQYNESARQVLLIKTARKVVVGPKILLALDADEIVAADALFSKGWKKMLLAQPGTVLCFEKPDLCEIPARCVRFYKQYWPLGYVDDGMPHNSSLIHSIRVPYSGPERELKIDDVKFLHYNLVRPNAQESKRRMYGVIESLLGTMPWRKRILNYRPGIDSTRQGPNEPCPDSWFRYWEEKGIDMRTIQDTQFYWQDAEVLRLIHKHGVERFRWEDIWDFNWELCRQWALTSNIKEIPPTAIDGRNVLCHIVMRITQKLLIIAGICYRFITRKLIRQGSNKPQTCGRRGDL